MYGKKLAYTVKIKDVKPIEGADKIELATVMDYTVVVKKNEFQPGDIAMYIEVDSVLPDGLDPVLKQKYENIKSGKELPNATKDEIKAALNECGFKNQEWVMANGVITTHAGPSAFGFAGFSKE